LVAGVKGSDKEGNQGYPKRENGSWDWGSWARVRGRGLGSWDCFEGGGLGIVLGLEGGRPGQGGGGGMRKKRSCKVLGGVVVGGWGGRKISGAMDWGRRSSRKILLTTCPKKDGRSRDGWVPA